MKKRAGAKFQGSLSFIEKGIWENRESNTIASFSPMGTARITAGEEKR